MAWKAYRHRFLPWIILNWKKRIRPGHVVNSSGGISGVNLKVLHADLCTYLNALDISLKEMVHSDDGVPFSHKHMGASFKRRTELHHSVGLKSLYRALGFTINRSQSVIEKAGTGVFVTKGTIPKHCLVALYPGLIYEPGEPVLLQSLANQFIFRCLDGVLVDGNDRRISKTLFRSCAGRDIAGSHLMCDISWLTVNPINVLSVGQYINNNNAEYPANVEYLELDLRADFPDEHLKYIPNINFSTETEFGDRRARRIVVLRSLREITTGEELFSTYFTVT